MTTKVFDTFTGTAGVDLAAHTPDTDVVGGGWIDGAVNTIELDGAGALKFSASNKQSWIDAGTADQWCVTSFRGASTTGVDNRMSIYLRRDNLSRGSANGYWFNIQPENSTGVLNLFKVVAGAITNIATTSAFAMDSVTTYSLEPEIDGSSLDFIIDSTSRLSVTDTTHTTGDYAGFASGAYADNTLRFYDFQIDDAAPAAGGATGKSNPLMGCFGGSLYGAIA